MTQQKYTIKICVECGESYQCCYDSSVINYICQKCDTKQNIFDKLTLDEKLKWLNDKCSK